jgi:hypothetical protein
MAYYRLYSLDPEDSHIVDVASFVADSDSAAIREVPRAVPGMSRELWNLGRKVMDFGAPAPIAPDDDQPNRFDKLIGSGAGWRWDPLQGNCQVVA